MRSRKAYLDYVASGVEQGRRDELMGGGLIRSLGGWSEVQQMRRKGPVDMMSDEPILGESERCSSFSIDTQPHFSYMHAPHQKGSSYHSVKT